MARTYQAEKYYQTAPNQTFKNLSKPKTFQASKTFNLKAFSKTDCVSSGDKYWR